MILITMILSKFLKKWTRRQNNIWSISSSLLWLLWYIFQISKNWKWTNNKTCPFFIWTFLPFQHILMIWELCSILPTIHLVLYVFQTVEFPQNTHKQPVYTYEASTLRKLQLNPLLEGLWYISSKISYINLERISRYTALKNWTFKQNPLICYRDYKNFHKKAFKTELCDCMFLSCHVRISEWIHTL